MIKVDNVSLVIKKQNILENVFLDVNEGEAVGLIGGNVPRYELKIVFTI